MIQGIAFMRNQSTYSISFKSNTWKFC